MCSARTRPSKWDFIHRLFRKSPNNVVEEKVEEIKSPTKIVTQEPVEQISTIKGLFGSRFPYIVRLRLKEDFKGREDIFISFSKEFEWCNQYTLGFVDYHLCAHMEKENDDWPIANFYIYTNPVVYEITTSMFFAFEREDEALIFAIKFKK